MRALTALTVAGFLAGSVLGAQDTSTANSIGMTFVRVQPGSMVVAKFEPPYPVAPDPNAPASGRGGRGASYTADGVPRVSRRWPKRRPSPASR